MFHRSCHARLQILGYMEEGTTTTPFDMAVLNGIDRFNLVLRTLDQMPESAPGTEQLREIVTEKLELHRRWIRDHGEDLPEVRDWRWGNGSSTKA